MDCLAKNSMCDYMREIRMKDCALVPSRTIRSVKGESNQEDQEGMAKDALLRETGTLEEEKRKHTVEQGA